MTQKLTRGIKDKACTHCKNANKAKLRQHRKNYCAVGFEAYNGHCKNFMKGARDERVPTQMAD